jgi:branched-chain amino acid transport system ATP-binding protein
MLKVEAITVAYALAPVLREVSMEINAGEVVALIGANGAGKTTLLKSISRLLACKSGSIRFEGRELNSLPPAQVVRMGISQVPEGRRVFPEMTVEENLEMGAYSRHRSAVLETEFNEVFDIFPVLSERRSQLADTLSGGEQQMLAIGRAMMAKPRLLLLDEPSMGLAPKLVSRIFEVVREIQRRGTTVLLVEQNAAMALRVSQRAYVIETGKVVMSGPSSELVADPRIAMAYLGGRPG